MVSPLSMPPSYVKRPIPTDCAKFLVLLFLYPPPITYPGITDYDALILLFLNPESSSNIFVLDLLESPPIGSLTIID